MVILIITITLLELNYIPESPPLLISTASGAAKWTTNFLISDFKFLMSSLLEKINSKSIVS